MGTHERSLSRMAGRAHQQVKTDDYSVCKCNERVFELLCQHGDYYILCQLIAFYSQDVNKSDTHAHYHSSNLFTYF